MNSNLGSHRFSAEQLQWFAAASGDYNPIHVDATAARRLIAGSLVVHGMFTMLTGLERFFAAGGKPPARLSGYFQKPVLAGRTVDYFQQPDEEDDAIRLFARCGEEEVASVRLIGAGTPVDGVPQDRRCDQAVPRVHRFADTKGLSGSQPVLAARADLDAAFAHTARLLGPRAVAGIMALSRIVGMECPGLHSLFTGLDIQFQPDATPDIRWQVRRHLSPYAPLQIAVEGSGFQGTLDAFVRPEPVTQAAIDEVAQTVAPGSQAGQRVLVVGGSRGLGELVAKSLAAGGAEVCITYATGADDAQQQAEQITAAGGHCHTARLDVTQLDGSQSQAIDSLLKQLAPTQIYYFATPRITANSSGDYDDAQYAAYAAMYVTAFAALVRRAASQTDGPLRVFFPSTVFIDQPPKGFAEYADAKRAGEQQCQQLMTEHPNLTILFNRLPRMKTDQTASLMPVSAAPALPEMQQVVRQMQATNSKDP